ncbi:MAG: hypothetical protein ACR2NX_16530, partial [Chthoniobacterales bacterium]
MAERSDVIFGLADLQHWRAQKRADEPPIRLGVFGDPVARSLSPRMQNAALEKCEIDARYAAFQIAPNELADA